MSEMVDRVARAIYEEDDPWHKAWPWPDLSENQGSPDQYRRIATAAINAMREPTDAMLQSGGRSIAHLSTGRAIEPYEDDARDAWQTMIDAAIGEQP